MFIFQQSQIESKKNIHVVQAPLPYIISLQRQGQEGRIEISDQMQLQKFTSDRKNSGEYSIQYLDKKTRLPIAEMGTPFLVIGKQLPKDEFVQTEVTRPIKDIERMTAKYQQFSVRISYGYEHDIYNFDFYQPKPVQIFNEGDFLLGSNEIAAGTFRCEPMPFFNNPTSFSISIKMSEKYFKLVTPNRSGWGLGPGERGALFDELKTLGCKTGPGSTTWFMVDQPNDMTPGKYNDFVFLVANVTTKYPRGTVFQPYTATLEPINQVYLINKDRLNDISLREYALRRTTNYTADATYDSGFILGVWEPKDSLPYHEISERPFDVKFVNPTGVENSKRTPSGFGLGQNYPNPFTASTKISYSLAKKAPVSLKVFNSLGQQVSELVNENKNPGSYEIGFDASSLPSGTYFYTLRIGEHSETKKMILLK